jgi:hypothetical protein
MRRLFIMTTNRTVLGLPTEVRKTEIYPGNLLKELCFFAQTSKQAELETAFLRLQHTAVYAEPESYEQKDETKLAAIAILKRHPELLFKEGIVKDHFGRWIKASPYRLFLGAGDSWALKQVHDEIIPMIKDGEAKAKEEYKKQFPRRCRLMSSNPTDDIVVNNDLYLYQENGKIWYATKTSRGIVRAEITKEEYKNHFDYLLVILKKSAPEKENLDDTAEGVLLDIILKDPKLGEEALYDARNIDQIDQVIAQLKTIVALVTADPCTHGQATLDVTRDAVSELRKIFAPKKGEIIETGLHFPLGILKEIYKVYDAQFNPWTSGQLSFFSREVIGSAEAAFTAVDGQSCKNGLNNLDMQKGPDRRDGLYCPKPLGIPKDKAPIGDKLGREMFVDPYSGYSIFLSSSPGFFDWYSKCAVALCAARSGLGWTSRAVLDNLWRTKAEGYGSYYAATLRSVNIMSRLP